MGGLISLLRDIKTIYKDLKVTLKLTARIVLKVHGIVDDVEHTVQELKAAVKGLSAKISPENGSGEVAFDALVENVESKATMLKTSLIEATSQVFNEDLLKNTQQKWDKVMEYSRQSSEALTNIIASTSFYTSVVQGASDAERTGVEEKNISLLELKEKEEEDEKSNAQSNQAIVPVFKEPRSTLSSVEEDVRDFEILPSFDLMDSFWKCDTGCFNIDCVDLQQLPARQQRNGEVNGQLRKRKTKKRNGKSAKLCKKTGISGTSSGHTPVKYHNHKQKRPRENIALEVIFLIALLVEGAAMSNNNLLTRERLLNESNYGSYSTAAEILELDD